MTTAATQPSDSTSLRPMRGSEGMPAAPQLVFRKHPETGQVVEGQLSWGLIPHHAERRPDFRPIHARAETIAEQKLFRDAYRHRRCIAPMTSFFQKDGNGRRYEVGRVDGQPFGVAAIWENWRDPQTFQWERSFALITVPANSLIAPHHDRMLAIIDPQDFPRWYGGEPDPRDLLKPYPSDLLTLNFVGKRRRAS